MFYSNFLIFLSSFKRSSSVCGKLKGHHGNTSIFGLMKIRSEEKILCLLAVLVLFVLFVHIDQDAKQNEVRPISANAMIQTQMCQILSRL